MKERRFEGKTYQKKMHINMLIKDRRKVDKIDIEKKLGGEK